MYLFPGNISVLFMTWPKIRKKQIAPAVAVLDAMAWDENELRRGFDAGLVRSPYPFATLCGSRDNAISEGGTCNIDECGWCCRARDGACTICHFGKLSPRIGLPLSHSCSPRELSRSSGHQTGCCTYIYVCMYVSSCAASININPSRTNCCFSSSLVCCSLTLCCRRFWAGKRQRA